MLGHLASERSELKKSESQSRGEIRMPYLIRFSRATRPFETTCKQRNVLTELNEWIDQEKHCQIEKSPVVGPSRTAAEERVLCLVNDALCGALLPVQILLLSEWHFAFHSIRGEAVLNRHRQSFPLPILCTYLTLSGLLWGMSLSEFAVHSIPISIVIFTAAAVCSGLLHSLPASIQIEFETQQNNKTAYQWAVPRNEWYSEKVASAEGRGRENGKRIALFHSPLLLFIAWNKVEQKQNKEQRISLKLTTSWEVMIEQLSKNFIRQFTFFIKPLSNSS